MRGKLDAQFAKAVCARWKGDLNRPKPVTDESTDRFPKGTRRALRQPNSEGPAMSADSGGTAKFGGADLAIQPRLNQLPTGLADHPDYDIIRKLDQGGMGTVYLAKNRLMGRQEVLKVVSSHLMKRPGILDRFLSEIRNAARLHHTNIVTAYSAVRFRDSIVFAMEYVQGLDLSKLVKTRRPLPVADVCNYAIQAALGLQHAHELGMVHRDIKPSNLMLASQGGRAVIKVLDFGLAKVKSEGGVDGGLTHEGQILGTPDYIAPEQISDARTADIRADIYSLGCTVYHLLTGAPPFKSPSLYALLQAHFSTDAMPLNLARPDVPVELAGVVAKMMAKQPEQRFQTPIQVAQAIKPFFNASALEFVGASFELSCAGERAATAVETRANVPIALPPLATNERASAPVAPPASATVWARLIDVAEPKQLAKAAPLLGGAKRLRRKSFSSTLFTALAVAAVALAGVSIYWPSISEYVEPLLGGPGFRETQARSTTRLSTMPRDVAPDSTATNSGSAAAQIGATRDRESRLLTNRNDGGRRPPAPVDKAQFRDTSAPSLPPVADDSRGERHQRSDSTVVALATRPVPRAVSPHEQLRTLGLERRSEIYLLSQESDLAERFRATKSLVGEYQTKLDKKIELDVIAAQMKGLEHENNARDVQIGQLERVLEPIQAGRNSDQKALAEEIRNQRDEIVRLRDAATFMWKELKSQLPSERQIRELDIALDRGRASCRAALRGLRWALEETDTKFEEVSKNEEVLNALKKIGGVKLGHEAGYETVDRQIKQWEALVESTQESKRRVAERLQKRKNSAMKKR
jgi:serine/threonine protein kinase